MDKTQLKKLIIDSFQMEEELREFCVDCLKKIYGEEADSAINLFNEGVESFDYDGCIQSLRSIESQFTRMKSPNANQ